MSPTIRRRRRGYHHGDLAAAAEDAAFAFIAERGAAEFTLRELAAAVDVTPGALYAHYRNKQALLDTLAVAGLAELQQRQQAAVASAGRGSLARLEALALAYVDFALERPGAYRLVFNSDLAAFGGRGVADARMSAASLMLATIRDGQRDGVLVAGDPEQLAFSLWAAAHGIAHLLISGHVAELPGAARNHAATVASAVDRLLRGALSPAGRRHWRTLSARA